VSLLTKNGRPTYMENGPAELWAVQTERSREWAQGARLEAEKRHRRFMAQLLLCLVLVLAGLALAAYGAYTLLMELV
jgi:hypothetical protein